MTTKPETVLWNEFVDTADAAEHARLALLEEVFDPFSRASLDRIGIWPGWRCLEIGAGRGSVARELAARAGAANVTAADLSTRLLGPIEELGVRVLRHDVLRDPAPGEFDLIHCRFVVDHLLQRQYAIERMVSWLRPGGILLVEAGGTAPALSSAPAVARAMAAANAVLERDLGTDPNWARRLPLPLEAAGLVGCGVHAEAPVVRGGRPLARWLRDTFRMVDDAVAAAGLLGREELERAAAVYDDPSYVDYTWMTVAAWGTKP
ncbi:class I SAM-dependent methyltransferase [Dactylosporangium sp. CA-052675]|uniref:class I SAM-dependent methyltransferase n=1 Tax=Dactylosporangium sp. CA-052675 TaxID=3239927 RepID=UPI003D916671